MTIVNKQSKRQYSQDDRKYIILPFSYRKYRF